jgi:hypothetical protein
VTAKPSEFDLGAQFVRAHFPDFEVRYKDESWTSKVIAVLVWIFNRRYLTEFTTTRYPRVYFPSRQYVAEAPRRAFKILMHEFVHMWDRRAHGLRHVFGYGFPQILAVLFLAVAAGALVAGALSGSFGPYRWAVAGPALAVALGCLAPLPAPFRPRAEVRGYSMNLALNFWRYGSILQQTQDWIADFFVGWEYYRMSWDRQDVLARLDRFEFALKEWRDYEWPLTATCAEGDSSPFHLVRDFFAEKILDNPAGGE